MLSTISLQLAFPNTAYTLESGAVTAVQKGSSMNSTAYVLTSSQLSAITGGLASGQLLQSLQRRGPGQKGSNRSQILFQIVALDVNGKPFVTSANLTLTEPNYFVPPAGVTFSQKAVSEACVAGALGYALNASGSATGSQSDWTDKSSDGIIL
jgi:hypothetical protein